MAIQPKSTIKPLFVDGATPNGTAFGDWIDSCAFLNTDSSSTLTSLRMPVSTNPASAPSGYKTLFFSSANSNNLYAINSSGVISAIAPQQYICIPFNSYTLRGNTGVNIYILATKYPIKITRVRGSQEGGDAVGTFSIVTRPTNGALIGNGVTAIALFPTGGNGVMLTTDFTITNGNIPVDTILLLSFAGFVAGTFNNGTITIEYEEVN